MHDCPIAWLTTFMSAIGAINWGLAAFLNFNLVEFIHSIVPVPYLNIIVYGIVAICGIYTLISLFTRSCGVCK